jgi:hypothetical protein
MAAKAMLFHFTAWQYVSHQRLHGLHITYIFRRAGGWGKLDVNSCEIYFDNSQKNAPSTKKLELRKLYSFACFLKKIKWSQGAQ